MSERFGSASNHPRPLPAAALLFVSASLCRSVAGAFSPPGNNPTAAATVSFGGRRPRRHFSSPPVDRRTTSSSRPLRSKIIDAEVIPDDDVGDHDHGGSIDDREMNLVEYSQNQDPDWKSMPVAFCDAESNTYVDCNLAFYARDPRGGDNSQVGAEYALGVPCEAPVVVALEFEDENGASDEDGDDASVVNLSKVIPINPDENAGGISFMKEEEKEEVFQMAARALMDEFGPTIRLKKTPRVLTVEGDLDAAIGDWREVLLGNASGEKADLSFEDAVNVVEDEDEEEEDDFFDQIMKRDLGPDYMKLVDDDDDDDGMDEELLKMFDAEGLDVDEDELEDDIAKKNDVKAITYEELVRKLKPSAALKLVNFLGPGGKEYTILRPLRPILLVGKEDPDDYTRRILLSEEERIEILPRLERACQEELEDAGFYLENSGDESNSLDA